MTHDHHADKKGSQIARDTKRCINLWHPNQDQKLILSQEYYHSKLEGLTSHSFHFKDTPLSDRVESSNSGIASVVGGQSAPSGRRAIYRRN